MKNQYIIPSLKQSVTILELIAEHQHGLTLGEISKRIDTPKATIFRILATLEHEHMVYKQDERYKIGYRAIKIGMLALSKLDLRNIAAPLLYELSLKLKETVHLAVLSDNKSLLIEVCDSPEPVNVSSRPGTAVALHSSSTGKIIIAYAIGEENIDEFFKDYAFEKRTANTINSLDSLKSEIKKIKLSGYAFDNEEYHEGVRCLAAPITDAYGNVIASVGMTATSFRFQVNMLDTISKEVMNTAKEISTRLGG